MTTFESTEKICSMENPLNWSTEKSRLMVAACREMALFHQRNSQDIKQLYERHQFDPNCLLEEEDLTKIPPVGVSAMKSFLMTSLPHENAILKLTSSGTRGQKTQIWFDQNSLDRVQTMMDTYLGQEGFVSNDPQNYMVFNYDPDDAGDLGIAYTEKNQLRFAPVNSVYFAIKKNSAGEWIFQKEKVLEMLKKYEAGPYPVRIFAMPAFLFEFLEYIQEKKITFKFSPESWILTGGGWKAAEDKKVSRSQFRQMCLEAFQIPLSQQRDAFGMAEHCAPYFECQAHRFHIAAYNRLIMRDPLTLEPVPHGTAGLMELITPFNAMMPTTAILSTDYAMIHNDKCACGYNSPTFEILGRAGITKHKGCALTASEIVRR